MNPAEQPETGVRLNRFLAEAGVCSRRDADTLVFEKRVTVNGTVISTPAWRIDPDRDAVKVNGRRILPQPLVYVLLHKPEGVVSTVEDPEKRTTVLELLRGVKARVYPVGRLDFNTSGVLLLTNDGELAQRLTHPRYGFPKTYHARVRGVPGVQVLYKLAGGVRIPTWAGRYEKTLPARVHLLKRMKDAAVLEMTLREGRQHQVKKMCLAMGHPVTALQRVKFGFLSAAGLPLGRWRYLRAEEIKKLKAFTPAPGHAPVAPRPGRPREGSFRKTGRRTKSIKRKRHGA